MKAISVAEYRGAVPGGNTVKWVSRSSIAVILWISENKKTSQPENTERRMVL